MSETAQVASLSAISAIYQQQNRYLYGRCLLMACENHHLCKFDVNPMWLGFFTKAVTEPCIATSH